MCHGEPERRSPKRREGEPVEAIAASRRFGLRDRLDRFAAVGRLVRRTEVQMLADDLQLQRTLDRIAWFYGQVRTLRKTATNPENHRASVSGFLAEIDRMQLEVREYLSVLDAERVATA
jgi:hypothetical protein